jgi:uncharacterized RDD family membrane protein YckC
VEPDPNAYEYAGFWIRVLAALIDTVLVLCVVVPLMGWFYGWDVAFGADDGFRPLLFAIEYLLPALATLVFWRYRAATPGKIAIRARIVDARTGGPPSLLQLILRYLGYYVSIFPLCLGLIWVGIDRRKQGFHDKIARTVVIRKKPEPVRFD